MTQKDDVQGKKTKGNCKLRHSMTQKEYVEGQKKTAKTFDDAKRPR